MVEINNAAPITKEQMDSNYKPLLSNLQGNILRSHKKKYANHIFLEFSDDKTKIKAWIRKLAGTHVTSDDQIYTRSNDPFISFVLSYSGYQALGILEQNIPANWGFRRGMNNPETSKIESSPKLVENSPRLPVLMLGDLRLGCPLDFQVPLQCVSQFG